MKQHVSPELRKDFWEQIPDHMYDTSKTNVPRWEVFSRCCHPWTDSSFLVACCWEPAFSMTMCGIVRPVAFLLFLSWAWVTWCLHGNLMLCQVIQMFDAITCHCIFKNMITTLIVPICLKQWIWIIQCPLQQCYKHRFARKPWETDQHVLKKCPFAKTSSE